MSDKTDTIKHRELLFRGPHAEASQAKAAMLFLSDAQGMLRLSFISDQSLMISYDLREITFNLISCALENEGFHLENTLLYKLKRALWDYTEETQRENLGLETAYNCQQCQTRIFAKRYQQRHHGCRDERPKHWRQYL